MAENIKPQRIKLSRSKGFDLQEVSRDLNGLEAVNREMMKLEGPRPDAIRARLGFLRGKNLACWCDFRGPCHADVLIELANG